MDAAWKPVRRLSDANPSEARLARSPGSRHYIYKTANGSTLRGVIHLPAGYVPGQLYPAVTIIYEEGEVGGDWYIPSGDRRIGRWLLKGYAVLQANIRPRFGESGAAALEAVQAAINSATATEVIDRNRLGLMGHSMGAFETYYIVANSELFRAAAPESGITNMLSLYGLESFGLPWSQRMEHHQPYLSGPWWEHWDQYVRNSPLFRAPQIRAAMLMIHGDRDDSAPFTQAVEMFNTLRRLGFEDAALLQYVGEGHSFSDSAQVDIDVKTEQFFDHFLKDQPAPEWWSPQRAVQ
jgi:dipeptidyl aminopeptidase/acylaminoacyl peptidase